MKTLFDGYMSLLPKKKPISGSGFFARLGSAVLLPSLLVS
jgi:hypothetical protein